MKQKSGLDLQHILPNMGGRGRTLAEAGSNALEESSS